MVPLSHVLHSLWSLLILAFRVCPFPQQVFLAHTPHHTLHSPVSPSALLVSLWTSPPHFMQGNYVLFLLGTLKSIYLTTNFFFFLLLALQTVAAQLAEKSATFTEGPDCELMGQTFRAQCKTVQPVCFSDIVKKLIPSVPLLFL